MAHTADHSDHAAATGPDDFVPHVVPIASYFAVFGALLVLTAITVGVSYFDFGEMNLVIALLVATIKATCVAAIFMHLAYDNKFNAIVLVSGLIFLAIFIAFTRFDIFSRGRADAVEATMPVNMTNPFDEKAGSKPLVPPPDHFRGAHKAAENHQTGKETSPEEIKHGAPH